REIFLRSSGCEEWSTALLARLRFDLRRVGNDRRSEIEEADVSGVASLSPPTVPVKIVLKKRDAKNAFQDLWTTSVDPADQFVDRSKPVAPAPLITIQKTGEPETKVDFLILGDGYTAAEAKKFEADARRLTEILFATS